MSTSSSATARERAPDSGPQAHPFPYTDTAAQAKPADPPEIEQKHAEQQRLQELEYARQRGQQEVRAEMDAALLRELAARARALRHRGLRRAPVDDESPAHPGGRIRGGQPEDVGILVHALTMPYGVDPRRGGALRDDHDKA